jgi:lactoylglutathione lyase
MPTLSYGIVFVHNMQRSIVFYRDVLGFPLKFESPEWTEFATEGVTLALHKADAPATSEAQELTPAGRCQLGFFVDDLDAFHAGMMQKTVTCIRPPREVFGVRLANYADPDGLPFSVSQNRP